MLFRNNLIGCETENDIEKRTEPVDHEILFNCLVSVRNIKEVRPGKNTEVMRNKEVANLYSEDCSFSIIYGDDFESLDLIALTPEEANIWVTGLNFLIGASKCKNKIFELKIKKDYLIRCHLSSPIVRESFILYLCSQSTTLIKLNVHLLMVDNSLEIRLQFA